MVTQAGIKPDLTKTDKVAHPVPTDITQLCQFLGLASYYQRFIKDFSKIATPLHALLKKDAPFNWSESCESAFNRLKSQLVSAPVLVYPPV